MKNFYLLICTLLLCTFGGYAQLSVPFTVDFEDTMENANWTIVNGYYTSNLWYIGTATNNTPDGSMSLYISDNGGVSNSYSSYADFDPPFVWAYRDITFTPTTGEYQLSFDWRGQGDGCCDFFIMYIGPPSSVLGLSGDFYTPSNATNLGSYSGSSSWVSDTIILPASYSGTTQRLYFLWGNDPVDAYNPPAAIDNIAIVTTLCTAPSNLTADNVTASSVDLSWFTGGSETAWNIEYGHSGFAQGSGTIISTTNNTYTIFIGLTAATAYQAYVRSDCNNGDFSTWIGPISFTTAQGICEVPTNLTVSGITENSADVSWSAGGSETLWTLEYKTFSSANYNSVNCSNNSYTLNGLSPLSDYVVRVKAICGTDNESDYISANFTTDSAQVITYTITASAGDNGTISPSGTISIPQGGNQTFTISPDNGYNIQDVLVDNVSQGDTSSYTFSNVQENHAISVSFSAQEITYTITASAGDNGTISPSGTISIPQGGSQTFTISPDNGYNIQDVLVDNVSQGDTSSYTFSNIQENHAISVSFSAQEITYTITASAGDNGTISPSGTISIPQGGNQTFSISPDNGYHIQDVSVDNVSQGDTSSYTFSNVQENHAISVSFIAGIEDNVSETDVLIFPNPANNVLNIKSGQLFEKIKITNLLGQVLYNAKITNSDFSINISSYTAGIYFVCLEGKNGIATKSLLLNNEKTDCFTGLFILCYRECFFRKF